MNFIAATATADAESPFANAASLSFEIPSSKTAKRLGIATASSSLAASPLSSASRSAGKEYLNVGS
jgi:D-arabinose 5-phosphate isomerase GutQ